MSKSNTIPSLAREVVPAGEGGVVREEVIGIHRALREVLRQLQKNPPRQHQPKVSKNRTVTHLRVQQKV